MSYYLIFIGSFSCSEHIVPGTPMSKSSLLITIYHRWSSLSSSRLSFHLRHHPSHASSYIRNFSLIPHTVLCEITFRTTSSNLLYRTATISVSSCSSSPPFPPSLSTTTVSWGPWQPDSPVEKEHTIVS